MNPKRPTPKLIKMPNVKDEGRILKATRKKKLVSYREFPYDCQLISQKRSYRQKGAGKKYSKSWKARICIQDCSTQQSCHLEWKGRWRAFQTRKTEGVHHHQTSVIWNVKETYLRKRRPKEGINKWDLIQLKSFCRAKENSIKMKREPTIWENICQWYLRQAFDLQNIQITHMTPF